jgi:hypothetical protein
MEKWLRYKLSMVLIIFALLIGCFYLVKNSFGAGYKKDGVSISLYGYYVGKGYWAENQVQEFNSSAGYPNKNTFQVFFQGVRLFPKISYGPKVHNEPLATLFTEVDLTNGYNGVSSGYGTNGWYVLGQTPAAIGFNHDFNTFGLKQAYLRLMTPIGAFLIGRMPVYLGLGIAMNTYADAIGDYFPINKEWAMFGGVLIGNETIAGNGLYNASAGAYPPADFGYTHIQMGTMPILAVVLKKPISNITGSIWISEAHLNQWGSYFQPAAGGYQEGVNPSTPESPDYPTANISFGGLSATYSNNGTAVRGEFDYFQGNIIPSSNLAAEAVIPPSSPASPYLANGTPNLTPFPIPSPDIAPLPVYSFSGKDAIDSWDIYLTAKTPINTSIFPLTLGAKFGAGSPIAAGHYDFTYYSQLENNSTFFGDVIDGYQAIQFEAPGLAYMYGPLPMSTDLANRYAIMGYVKEHLPGDNSLRESVIYASWLKTTLNINGTNYQMFGGHPIGTEFDLNFTHRFSKTITWRVWASTVITGSGLDSFSYPIQSVGETNPAPTSVPVYSYHKTIYALGTAFVWAF